MARKNYPWRASDFNYGSKLVVNIILFAVTCGYFLIKGIVYLIMKINENYEFTQLLKSLMPTHKFSKAKKGMGATLYDRNRWLLLVNDRDSNYERFFEDENYIYFNTSAKSKLSLDDTVYLYMAKGKRVRFKTRVVDIDILKRDVKYRKNPQPIGQKCKLRIIAEYKGWALCESNLKFNGEFGGEETITYPMSDNIRLLNYVEEKFSDLNNIILKEVKVSPEFNMTSDFKG